MRHANTLVTHDLHKLVVEIDSPFLSYIFNNKSGRRQGTKVHGQIIANWEKMETQLHGSMWRNSDVDVILEELSISDNEMPRKE